MATGNRKTNGRRFAKERMEGKDLPQMLIKEKDAAAKKGGARQTRARRCGVEPLLALRGALPSADSAPVSDDDLSPDGLAQLILSLPPGPQAHVRRLLVRLLNRPPVESEVMFLTDDELQALTGHKRRNKQIALAVRASIPARLFASSAPEHQH